MSTALSTYTLLTIGDGLVAQIPALLIAIGAGFIVTRVNDDEANLGRNMMAQLFAHPFVLGITALLAVGVGLLPGFPIGVFLIIASTLVVLLFFAIERKRIRRMLTVLSPRQRTKLTQPTVSWGCSKTLMTWRRKRSLSCS